MDIRRSSGLLSANAANRSAYTLKSSVVCFLFSQHPCIHCGLLIVLIHSMCEQYQVLVHHFEFWVPPLLSTLPNPLSHPIVLILSLANFDSLSECSQSMGGQAVCVFFIFIWTTKTLSLLLPWIHYMTTHKQVIGSKLSMVSECLLQGVLTMSRTPLHFICPVHLQLL